VGTYFVTQAFEWEKVELEEIREEGEEVDVEKVDFTLVVEVCECWAVGEEACGVFGVGLGVDVLSGDTYAHEHT
jgi:hypothetical protein